MEDRSRPDSHRPTEAFNAAAVHPRIVGGLEHLIDRVISRHDVTIFSDNHFTSQTKYADLLTRDALNRYAGAGIRHIHLEMPQILNADREKLLRGEYTPGDFARRAEETLRRDGTEIQGFDNPVKTREMFATLGRSMLDAQARGITVHFSMVDFTREQQAAVEAARVQGEEIARPAQESMTAKINDIEGFLKQAGIPAAQYRPFMQSLLAKSNIEDALNPGALEKVFPGRLSDEQLSVLDADLRQLHNFSQEVDNAYHPMVLELISNRIAGDTTLALKVQETIDGNAGGAPGRAIVFHGTLHGGTSTTDLDDHLTSLGSTAARVNLTYSPYDRHINKHLVSEGYMRDPSDIYFNPRNDTVEFEDMNRDGIIQAGPSLTFTTPPDMSRSPRP